MTLIIFYIYDQLWKKIPLVYEKFIVETYYTCTFKTVHTLNDLNDKELSKIDSRTDGSVEVIDIKLNNRKTKKLGDQNDDRNKKLKLEETTPSNIKRKL